LDLKVYKSDRMSDVEPWIEQQIKLLQKQNIQHVEKLFFDALVALPFSKERQGRIDQQLLDIVNREYKTLNETEVKEFQTNVATEVKYGSVQLKHFEKCTVWATYHTRGCRFQDRVFCLFVDARNHPSADELTCETLDQFHELSKRFPSHIQFNGTMEEFQEMMIEEDYAHAYVELQDVVKALLTK